MMAMASNIVEEKEKEDEEEEKNDATASLLLYTNTNEPQYSFFIIINNRNSKWHRSKCKGKRTAMKHQKNGKNQRGSKKSWI